MASSKHWCFTKNNWTDLDDQHFQALDCEYIVYGYEVAETTGTAHLQGYVVFANRKYFSTVQQLLPAGTHIEPRRGSAKQARDYCIKDGLFFEKGVCPTDGVRSRFDEYQEWLESYFAEKGSVPTEREIACSFPSMYLQYSNKLLSLASLLAPPTILQEGEFREWQAELAEILTLEPDDRKCLFYVDPVGGVGKTWFYRRLYTMLPDRVQLLSVGKRDDLAHVLDTSKDIFLFNVPREGMEYFQYTICEQLKDRVVFSPKYNSQMKVWKKNVHVVVFCNEMPNMTKMTTDRYWIRELSINLTE